MLQLAPPLVWPKYLYFSRAPASRLLNLPPLFVILKSANFTAPSSSPSKLLAVGASSPRPPPNCKAASLCLSLSPLSKAPTEFLSCLTPSLHKRLSSNDAASAFFKIFILGKAPSLALSKSRLAYASSTPTTFCLAVKAPSPHIPRSCPRLIPPPPVFNFPRGAGAQIPPPKF